MGKKVEKIVINTESVDIISVVEGVNSVTQIGLESTPEEINQICFDNNINNVIIYPYDNNIVRALAESEEQLKDYLETCRRAHYSNTKVNVPDTVPNIEYDLRDLKNGFFEISDNKIRTIKQLDIYKKAKETQNILRGTKGKVEIKMGVLDKGYFTIQDLLQNRNKNKIIALNPGITEERKKMRSKLYNPEYTERTNVVSKEYSQRKPVIEKENEEFVK